MTPTPALNLDTPAAPLFQGGGETITRAAFAATAQALAARLPAGDIVNRCATRSRFALTLIAAGLAGRHCHLVGSDGPLTAGVEFDDAGTARAFDDDAGGDAALTLPPLRERPPLATVYTSGSTGMPAAHGKTWRSLWHAGRALHDQLLAGLDGVCLVATVPPHHMYGLETSIAMALAGHCCVHDGRPSFPEDMRRALDACDGDAVLVTTPVHLRALLESGARPRRLARVISATAPLPTALAERVEQTFGTEVHEIYGCTEAGSMATRRSVAGPLWTPLPGIKFHHDALGSTVEGVHLPDTVMLHDRLQAEPGDGARRFRLLGRTGDLVKVAGKRASLNDLSQKLLSIPGIVDGIVFQPDGRDDSAVLQRLAALVVAPTLSEGEILGALSRLVDPVFLPRPLRRVDCLPRNATGKLPRETLQRLLGHA